MNLTSYSNLNYKKLFSALPANSYRQLLPTLYYFPSTKHDSIPLFKSFDIHRSHHLVGCYAAGLILCSCLFALFLYVTPIHEFNINLT